MILESTPERDWQSVALFNQYSFGLVHTVLRYGDCYIFLFCNDSYSSTAIFSYLDAALYSWHLLDSHRQNDSCNKIIEK